MLNCPICERAFETGRTSWLLRCPGCEFERSTLAESISDAAARGVIDERARSNALNSLRERNFQTILEAVGRLREGQGALLEVGCAHGWFLRAAERRGWNALGIEPDPDIARLALQNGSPVRSGMFPQALRAGERFDVIAFNDVFEHLPDVSGALQACAGALQPGGLLVINLPDARGAFYRFSCLLARAGYGAPLERLWQKGFPSPHLSYFTAPLLRRLAAKHGFRPVHSGRLPSVWLRGLWSRLRYDRSAGLLGSAAAWAGSCLLMPALRLLPPDISLEIFETPGAG